MIRILHISDSMNHGGIENFIMNIYRTIDRSKVQFDFIQFKRNSVYNDEILELGGKIYYLPGKGEDIISNFRGIRKIVKDNNYKIVHRHFHNASMAFELLATVGITKCRIAHSHSSSSKRKKVHRIFKPLLKLVATDNFACSELAGKWMFGNSSFEIIKNGISYDRFRFSNNKRDYIRSLYHIESGPIIGIVGRLSDVKNHIFVINIFEKICKQLPDAKLLIVGDGEERSYIENEVNLKGLNQNVIMTGARDNIDEYMCAMDVFIMPSKYEGLGIALIEAQVSGLSCFVSDVIPDEAIISDFVYKISLEQSIDYWSDRIIENIKEHKMRNICNDNGYEISYVAKYLEEFYIRKAN